MLSYSAWLVFPPCPHVPIQSHTGTQFLTDTICRSPSPTFWLLARPLPEFPSTKQVKSSNQLPHHHRRAEPCTEILANSPARLCAWASRLWCTPTTAPFPRGIRPLSAPLFLGGCPSSLENLACVAMLAWEGDLEAKGDHRQHPGVEKQICSVGNLSHNGWPLMPP